MGCKQDQLAEGIQGLMFACLDMRRRLNRVARALGCFDRNRGIQKRLDRIDRDLVRFRCEITQLSLKTAQPRQERSGRGHSHACFPHASPGKAWKSPPKSMEEA